MTAHGKATTYQHGCRCVPCTTANRELTRRCRLRRQGWTTEQYATAFEEQGGRCAICRQPDARYPQLVTDHDHETGRRRGLLCNRCNLILGQLQDSPAVVLSMFEYLAAYV